MAQHTSILLVQLGTSRRRKQSEQARQRSWRSIHTYIRSFPVYIHKFLDHFRERYTKEKRNILFFLPSIFGLVDWMSHGGGLVAFVSGSGPGEDQQLAPPRQQEGSSPLLRFIVSVSSSSPPRFNLQCMPLLAINPWAQVLEFCWPVDLEYYFGGLSAPIGLIIQSPAAVLVLSRCMRWNASVSWD